MKHIVLYCFITAFICTVPAFAHLYPAPRPAFKIEHSRQVKSAHLINNRYSRTNNLFQVEMGVQTASSTLFDNTQQTEGAYPDILVRYGLFPALELRLETGYHTFESNGESVSGLGPISIGTKLLLYGGRGLLPHLSFIGSAALPVLAHEKFRPTVVAPALRLAASHTIDNRWEVGYNLGAEWKGVNALATGVYAMGLTYDLSYALRRFHKGLLRRDATALQFGLEEHQPGEHHYLNQSIIAFVELSGNIAKPGTSHAISGGLAYSLSPAVKIDVSAGVGLNRNAPDYCLGAGLSFRTATY